MTDGCPTHVINDDSLQEKCAAKTMAMALYVRLFLRSTAMYVCVPTCRSIVRSIIYVVYVHTYVCNVKIYRGIAAIE